MGRRRRRSRRERRGRGVIFWVLLLVVMLFLVVGFLRYWDQIKDLTTTLTAPGPAEVQQEPTTAEETSSPLEEEPPIAEDTTGSPEENNGVRVVVSVVSAGGVGLSILEDGQLVYDQVASPGFVEEFQGEEAVTVTAAEGEAVLVGVDDENPEPLGVSDEWTTRTFTAESES